MRKRTDRTGDFEVGEIYRELRASLPEDLAQELRTGQRAWLRLRNDRRFPTVALNVMVSPVSGVSSSTDGDSTTRSGTPAAS